MVNKFKIVASIEARMASSRLPGKVLSRICDVPVLAHMVRRIKRSSFIDEIIIATTTSPQDEAVCRLAKSEGVYSFQGSEDNVLERVVEAHKKMDTDIIAGIESEIETVLVLSGVTRQEAITRFAYRPNHILAGVGEIPAASD